MFNVVCSHLSTFLYFYLILEHMDRIVRELDTSTKEKIDLVGGGGNFTHKTQTPTPHALHSLHSLFL